MCVHVVRCSKEVQNNKTKPERGVCVVIIEPILYTVGTHRVFQDFQVTLMTPCRKTGESNTLANPI